MWQKQNNQLYREFTFEDFDEAFIFMQSVARIAQKLNHHPRWLNEWNKVEFWLTTHDAGQVTEKDEMLSHEIDKAYEALKGAPKTTVKMPPEAKLFCDGGSRGNPGPSAGGFVITTMDDQILYENGKYLGITTNNQAEYHSLKGGLEAALNFGIKRLHVFMDSLLVVNQINGIYKIKNRDLWPIHEAIKKLNVQFEKISFSHVPRELNKQADRMVNETLDAQKR